MAPRNKSKTQSVSAASATFASASALAFWAGLQAPGVWIGLSLGTAVYATLLILRFRLLARRLGR
jgi:Na+-driven multidrug efflux pump